MKNSTISIILSPLFALLISCCSNVGDKPQSQTFNIGTHYVKDGKSSSITFSSMEEAEQKLIHYFFPNGMSINQLPFDRHAFDYDLFEQIVQSNASSMNYPFDSLQHYANIYIIDSPDGNVRYYTWDYPHAHTMSDFHTIIQYRWNGKVICQKPDTSEDNWCVLSPNSLHILKGKACNYYLTTAYFRESSNIGYMNFEITKLTKKGLQPVDFWDASYEYFISDWYFRTNGEGYDWLDCFDEKTTTLYVAEEDGLCLTDRYWCYPLDLQRKKQRQEKTPTFARVNQRREVNYRAIQPHELSTETVLFSFPLNGRANYICRFRDLIKDVVSSTPG